MLVTVVIVALLLFLVAPEVPWSRMRPRRPLAGSEFAPPPAEPSIVDLVAGDPDPEAELWLACSPADSDWVEKLLVARLLSGQLEAAEYRRGMTRLAHLDDLMNPVAVPPPRPTDTDPRPEP